MDRNEAAGMAQQLADEMLDFFIEHEPCVALLTVDSEMHICDEAGYEHPLDVLRPAAFVVGRPWVGVVVVADGTARDYESGEEIGRVRTVTVCFGGQWWADLVLSPLGVKRGSERPTGAIPDAMEACVRRPSDDHLN